MGDKILSFIGGFVLNILIGIGVSFLAGALYDICMWFPLLFASIIEVIIVIYFFRNNRYVAIGMLAALVMPLFVVGFCL